jgi:hypothetical protein
MHWSAGQGDDANGIPYQRLGDVDPLKSVRHWVRSVRASHEHTGLSQARASTAAIAVGVALIGVYGSRTAVSDRLTFGVASTFLIGIILMPYAETLTMLPKHAWLRIVAVSVTAVAAICCSSVDSSLHYADYMASEVVLVHSMLLCLMGYMWAIRPLRSPRQECGSLILFKSAILYLCALAHHGAPDRVTGRTIAVLWSSSIVPFVLTYALIRMWPPRLHTELASLEEAVAQTAEMQRDQGAAQAEAVQHLTRELGAMQKQLVDCEREKQTWLSYKAFVNSRAIWSAGNRCQRQSGAYALRLESYELTARLSKQSGL